MRHKKIPGKKHKGYKDLEAQHAKRNELMSQKVRKLSNPGFLQKFKLGVKFYPCVEVVPNILIYFTLIQINSTPNNPDEQEMPKKLRLLIKAKNTYLEQQKKKKTHDGSLIDHGSMKCEDAEDPNLLDSTKHMGYAVQLYDYHYAD